MERTVKDLSLLAALLGLAAATASFVAEITKIDDGIKASDNCTMGYDCIYASSNPTVGLGLTASVFLILAQVAIIFATRHACLRPEEDSKLISISQKICHVLSWIAFVIAMAKLVDGTVLNQQNLELVTTYGNHNFTVIKSGIFSPAGFLALTAVFFGIFAVNLTSACCAAPDADADDMEKQTAAASVPIPDVK